MEQHGGTWLTTSNANNAFAQLLARAHQRDEDALADLYRLAFPIVGRYVAVRLHGQPEAVEDLVSDIFVTMVESIDTLRAEKEASFFAWILQIAQAKIARTIEQSKRQRRSMQPIPEDSGEHVALGLVAKAGNADPVFLHEWREMLEELGEALEILTPEQQMIIIGRFLAGQSIESLAQALHKQPGNIRVLQFRALGIMAEHLGQTRTPRKRR